MSDTPRTDAAEFNTEGCTPFDAVSADFARTLERELTTLTASCAAKHSALVECRGYIDRLGQEGVRERADKALSDTAGQELLANIADLETSRQHYKDLLHAEERDCEAAEKALFAAKELFREIRDGEVNEQDEADKFLRDHQPSALSLSQARVKALEDALGWASSEAKGRLPDWFHDLLKGDATPVNDAETLAEMFHETYERRAGEFGYKTREASAVPWRDVPENNKRLMIAVCGELIARKALAAKGGETV